jgi:predicted DNA-binding transcriptional regulator AlpA
MSSDATDRDLEALLADLPPMLGVAELAKLTGLAEATLRNRHHRGDPPRAVKAGRRIRYTKRAIVEWLRSST